MAEDIFDQARFSSLVDDVGEGPGRRALAVFVRDVAARLDRVGIIDGASGAKQVATLAHTIKSSAAMFGFDQLSSLARKLEADTDQLAESDLSARVDELRAAFATVRALASQPVLAPLQISR